MRSLEAARESRVQRRAAMDLGSSEPADRSGDVRTLESEDVEYTTHVYMLMDLPYTRTFKVTSLESLSDLILGISKGHFQGPGIYIMNIYHQICERHHRATTASPASNLVIAPSLRMFLSCFVIF